MRIRVSAAFVLASVLPLSVLSSSPSLADTLRIAVVGFDSAEPSDDVRALSSALRDELAKAIDKGTFEVVSRDEMSTAYYARGGPCLPTDTSCLLDASARWNGRLFVRGHTQRDDRGVVVEVTLESVRGLLVASGTARVAEGAPLSATAPALARQLVEGERAFRVSGKGKAGGASAVTAAPAVEAGTAGPEACRGEAIIGTAFVAGTLVDVNGALAVRDANGAALASVAWARVDEVRATDYGGKPALHVLSTSSPDALLVTYPKAKARDVCARWIKERLALTKKPT